MLDYTQIVYLLSLLILLIMFMSFKDFYFDGLESDQFKQLRAANKISFNDWPSKMHLHGQGKCGMKDVGVLFLKIFNLINLSKNKYLPFVFLGIISHVIGGILIFKVSNSFFEIEVSFLLFILYSLSFWPSMMIAYGGFQLTCNLFYLSSIFLLTLVNDYYLLNLLLYFFSGVFFCLSNFTSASARKLVFIYLSVFIFFFYNKNHLELDFNNYEFLFSDRIILILITFFLFFLTFLYTKLKLKEISIFFYKKNYSNKKVSENFKKKKIKSIRFNLNKLISKIFIFFLFFLITFSIFLIFTHNLNLLNFSYIIAFILGIILSLIYLLGPNFIYNLKFYYDYWTVSSKNINNLLLSKDKKIINHSKIKWYINFLLRFYLPKTIFFIFILVLNIIVNNDFNFYIYFLFFTIFCFSPIIFGELTNGPKVAPTIFMNFIPFIFLCGYLITPIYHENILMINILILIYIFWNLYIIIFDTIESSNYLYKISKEMKNKRINLIYTYNTLLNEPFLYLIKKVFLKKLKIKYIKSIEDVNNGYIFIPSLNNISSYNDEIVKNIDDKYVKNRKFLKNKSINMIKRFKNRSTSKYWKCFAEANSVRYLVLNIGNEKINDGFCYLLKKD